MRALEKSWGVEYQTRKKLCMCSVRLEICHSESTFVKVWFVPLRVHAAERKLKKKKKKSDFVNTHSSFLGFLGYSVHRKGNAHFRDSLCENCICVLQ